MQLNSKYLVLIPALLLAGFIACSDDDDPPATGGGNNNNTTVNNNTTNNTTTNNNTTNNTVANVITGDPTDLTGRGQWGGLVLSGLGIENDAEADGELLTEAAPEGQDRWFGGMDNTDSSGSIQYAIIAESGFAFRPNQEVQGLTIEAAGSGTTIDYLQVLGSEDDCIEWFGGAASASHLICQGQDDDGLDIDEGYVGNIQFAIIIMGNGEGDRGIESDNNSDLMAMPISAPNIANVTILGDVGRMDKTTIGAIHVENFQGKIYRSVYTDNLVNGTAFEGGCLDVDDVLGMGLQYRDVIFNCSGGVNQLADDDDGQGMAGSFQAQGVANGQIAFTEGTGLMLGNNLAADVSNIMGLPGMLTPLPAGLATADYHGAVNPDGSDDWWAGWTYINSGVNGNLPGMDFHPLEAEITGGMIAPAASNACATLDASYTDGGVVSIFGQDFPVCVVSQDIEADVTWPNSHVFLLDGTVSVGNGDGPLDGGMPTQNVTLTIEQGTHVLVSEDSRSSLVITRGSEIQANGTANMPIIFSAVGTTL